MKLVANKIPGYTFGSEEVSVSPVSPHELDLLITTVGLTDEDWRYLRMAGTVLAGQTAEVVKRWRNGIIAGIPHLARHTRTPEGTPIPEYQSRSNLRFEQWILDTCLRPYDQNWLNYQQEIALRHTSMKKNQVDQVRSTLFIPLHDILAFVPQMNETIRPYLGARGHSPEDVDGMHRAWCKAIQLQIALWSKTYTDGAGKPNEW